MIVYLKSVAAMGHGFENWQALQSVFAGRASLDAAFTPRPTGSILPAVERRRASLTIKLATDIAQQAVVHSGMNPEDLAMVFASSNGDTNTIHQICEALATPERSVSPTRFHNSVHNAAAGYWSIASGSMKPSSSICAWDDSFSAGLVEAATQCLSDGLPVLLVAYDTPFPEPLADCTPGHQLFGVAMVLDARAETSLAGITLTVSNDEQLALTQLSDPTLEALRCDSSASRALPLLEALANPDAQEIVLGYSGDLRLRVAVNLVALSTSSTTASAV